MAPSSPLPETPPTPSLAWLLCAACGPLGEDVALRTGFSFLGEVGVQRRERRYEVLEPLPFPELRRLVQGNTALQEAMEQVEAARSRGGAKKRPMTHAEIAGQARAALLLGKHKLFLRHYKEYVQERAYEWHPDPEHFLFWDSVLGPGWAGTAYLPEGAALDDVLLLSARAYAFCPLPAESARGRGLCGAPEYEEWLEMAAALREADGGAVNERMFEGSHAARTACELMGGIFELAQQNFERLFSRTEEARYLLVQNHGLPLLIYALIGGVFAGASPRFLRSWFSTARYALQYVFPPSMVEQEAQLSLFLDHLEQVDALVNRCTCLVEAPQFKGALSCLPFAMFYTSLPAYMQQRLGLGELVEAVCELERSGLRLLALYGAKGLQRAEALSPEQQEQLEALQTRSEVSPTLPPAAEPMPQRALGALRGCVQKLSRYGCSLRLARYAQPPTLCASRLAEGLYIELPDEEDGEEYEDSPALRCMKKYAGERGQLLLEGASLAELTRLLIALQPQVEVLGSLALPGEELTAASPQPVLLLAHEGGGQILASLRVKLLPGSSLLLVPGSGLEIPVLELEDGRSLAVKRQSAAEWAVIEQSAHALQQAGIETVEELVCGVKRVDNLVALASLLRACRAIGLECCWEKGYALRLHTPQGGLLLRRGKDTGGWLELGGELPVDEGRVLELSALLESFSAREGNLLRLSGGEYVMLNPALERQLALLELVWQEKQGKRGVTAAALPLLESLDGSAAAPVAPASPPEGLQATLRPYQEEGFCWLAERAQSGLGALLADDMGLGKTVQVLALLLHAAQRTGAGASLVVAPVSLLGNWAEEAARFAPSLQLITYDPRRADCLTHLHAGVLVLASYGQIASRQKEFASIDWDVVALDEAQAIKNPDSQRARALCTLSARARLCLTGTPIENSLLDMWSQMRFLNPGLLGARAAFQRRFKAVKAQEGQLLRQVLAPLVLRRTKAEVLTQLPPLTETIEWVEFSKDERALYESLRRSALRKLGQGGETGGIGILAELTRLRRACCHGKLALAEFAGNSAKLLAMVERVEELRAAGRRTLIFSQFTDVLDLAQELLLSEGVSCLRLDGSTPASQRSKTVKAFQEGRADAFLISLKAGGAGLNLTAADYVLLLDPWWNPAVEAQAAGRSHRMGQEMPVTLCRFMVRGTVEERILALHAEKKELAESILSGSGEALSLANLRALLGN